jgi:hypothetical protein
MIPKLSRACYEIRLMSHISYFAGIKLLNSLPSNLKSLPSKRAQFKVALKRYLNTHSFYSAEEFPTFKNDS